jgi:hypothetical protein
VSALTELPFPPARVRWAGASDPAPEDTAAQLQAWLSEALSLLLPRLPVTLGAPPAPHNTPHAAAAAQMPDAERALRSFLLLPPTLDLFMFHKI